MFLKHKIVLDNNNKKKDTPKLGIYSDEVSILLLTVLRLQFVY